MGSLGFQGSESRGSAMGFVEKVVSRVSRVCRHIGFGLGFKVQFLIFAQCCKNILPRYRLGCGKSGLLHDDPSSSGLAMTGITQHFLELRVRECACRSTWHHLPTPKGSKYHYGIYLDPRNTLYVYTICFFHEKTCHTIMILGAFGTFADPPPRGELLAQATGGGTGAPRRPGAPGAVDLVA